MPSWDEALACMEKRGRKDKVAAQKPAASQPTAAGVSGAGVLPSPLPLARSLHPPWPGGQALTHAAHTTAPACSRLGTAPRTASCRYSSPSGVRSGGAWAEAARAGGEPGAPGCSADRRVLAGVSGHAGCAGVGMDNVVAKSRLSCSPCVGSTTIVRRRHQCRRSQQQGLLTAVGVLEGSESLLELLLPLLRR